MKENFNVDALLAQITTSTDPSQIDSTVVEAVIKAKVDNKITEFAEILNKALDKHAALRSEVSKIRPDQKLVGVDGTKVEFFSEAKDKEKKKAIQNLKEFEEVFNAVLAKVDVTPPNPLYEEENKKRREAWDKLKQKVGQMGSKKTVTTIKRLQERKKKTKRQKQNEKQQSK